ncbi:hypothetical protein AB1N83_012573 [Pleurotus pulmonarius]
MRQYPASNSGTQSDDNWSYTIDFMNTMPMFSNGGNSVFDFEASYKEDFFAATAEPDEKIDDHTIIGLSVFKCLDPAVFPVTFTFEASARGEMVTVPKTAL